ncbi:MAG: hypothetical protein KGO94_04300 [Alphaproteobacteria bacterium]|nr:hypothetical protein [Alphaproteobacteria bacterium]
MSLHQALLILHLFSVAVVMGVGISNLISFRVQRKLEGEAAKGVAKAREATLIYSDIFVMVLVAAGLGLLWQRGGAGGLNAWFHVKMAAVAVWLACFVAMRIFIARFLHNQDAALMPRIKLLAHVAITGAMVALVSAVLAFAG